MTGVQTCALPIYPKLAVFDNSSAINAVLCWCCATKGFAKSATSDKDNSKLPKFTDNWLLIKSSPWFWNYYSIVVSLFIINSLVFQLILQEKENLVNWLYLKILQEFSYDLEAISVSIKK